MDKEHSSLVELSCKDVLFRAVSRTRQYLSRYPYPCLKGKNMRSFGTNAAAGIVKEICGT
jgi:hypothetical protein